MCIRDRSWKFLGFSIIVWAVYSVFTGGDNTYSGAITLGATSKIVSTGGAQTISGATNGGHALTITSSDNLVISGNVGDSTELSSYTINSSGDATISVNVTTSGNQSYTASNGFVLSGARTFEGGTITFASTTTGDNNLTITGNLVNKNKSFNWEIKKNI